MKKSTNFTTVRKKTKGVRMVHQDLRKFYPVGPFAEKILDRLEEKVSCPLKGTILNLMQGFGEDMQVELADNINDFASKHVAHTTGIVAADIVLDLCYQMIAFEHDILKKGEKSRVVNTTKKS